MECPICWEDLVEEPAEDVLPPPNKKSKTDPTTSSSLVCLPCGHILHKECILAWFQQLNWPWWWLFNRIRFGTCPTCRLKVGEDKFYPVNLTTSEPKNTPKSNDEESITDIKMEPSSGTSTLSSSISTTSLPSPETSTSSTATTAMDTGNSTIECKKESCQDLLIRFKLLEKDFHEVLTKLQNETKRADLNQAMVDSLSLQSIMTTAKDREANENASAENVNNARASQVSVYELSYDEDYILDRDFNDDY